MNFIKFEKENKHTIYKPIYHQIGIRMFNEDYEKNKSTTRLELTNYLW